MTIIIFFWTVPLGMRKPPIGIQSFREIRERGAYFVDKSELIDDVLNEYATKAFLFTRPRRFGKSTNLSMLDAYLNLKFKGNTWFDGLKVSELRPDDPEKNAYPVVYLDLKDLGGDYEGFIRGLADKVSMICRDFLYILESERIDEVLRERFDSYYRMRSDEYGLRRSLLYLTVMLHMHHGRRVVVLVDEYDNPLNASYGTADQRRILEFVRDLLSSALKGNDNLQLGVVTGVMQIAKESIFSGLNNLKVNNILSTDMDERFGFTPDEVRRMCEDFDNPEAFDTAREWYDGYRFGDADIYNPWSVLNFVDQGFRPDMYWAGTSGNSIIDDLLSVNDAETYENLMVLGSGGSISTGIDSDVTFADISDLGEGIYSVLAFSGYLTVESEGGRHRLRIPNREMYKVFARGVLNRLGSRVNESIKDMSRALLSNDVQSLTEGLGDLFKGTMSSRILDSEHSYQAFIVGLLMNLYGNYRITADFESGEGYHDIRMERIHGNGPNVVIELKRAGPNDDASALAQSALEQIRSRDYAHGLGGRIILYGVAFSGKAPAIASEVIGQ